LAHQTGCFSPVNTARTHTDHVISAWFYQRGCAHSQEIFSAMFPQRMSGVRYAGHIGLALLLRCVLKSPLLFFKPSPSLNERVLLSAPARNRLVVVGIYLSSMHDGAYSIRNLFIFLEPRRVTM
jgi:hypothetical protein